MADSLRDVRAQVNQIAPSIQSLFDASSSVRTEYGGDKLVRDVETAAKLVDGQQARQRDGGELRRGRGHVRLDRPGPDGAAGQRGLQSSPSCSATRQQFERLVAARDDGAWTRSTLAGELQSFGRQTLTATVNKLNEVRWRAPRRRKPPGWTARAALGAA